LIAGIPVARSGASTLAMSRVGPNISVKRTAFRGRLPRALDHWNELRGNRAARQDWSVAI